MIRIVSLLLVGLLLSCDEDVLPKPNSFLRLEYEKATYKSFDDKEYPFSFQYSKDAKVIEKKKYWLDIYYPNLNATLVLSYMHVKGNLMFLLKDAEKLTFKHMIKADDIQAVPYENTQSKVYGKIFEVYGNAATQIQFHATDSVSNFMTGALYFYAKPNYDSIMPAVHYLKKDIVRLMETIEWKKEEYF
ncbi:gliding motility lipoprotein GldD [Flavicella sp.]|uniref:gliding motility lipoprotein GldD n=1 Tax=Flavicella sp. TaxID=2957742 RepID=UPI003018158D